jgi:hypothetical protein
MDWQDDTGLVRLPGGARVWGRRLADPASTADFAWSWPAALARLAPPVYPLAGLLGPDRTRRGP